MKIRGLQQLTDIATTNVVAITYKCGLGIPTTIVPASTFVASDSLSRFEAAATTNVVVVAFFIYL